VVDAFEGRILALSKAHTLLGRENWDGVGLRDVMLHNQRDDQRANSIYSKPHKSRSPNKEVSAAGPNTSCLPNYSSRTQVS
jgi:hypothetical protein